MRTSLLFCSVVVSCTLLVGCQRPLTPDSGVSSRVDSHTDQGIAPEGGAARPPGADRKARLINAMRGLTYDSGRVEIDRNAAGKIVRDGTVEQATASFEQGEELLEHNRRVEAIEAFTRAVLIAPGEAVFYEGLGRALMGKGLGKEAEAAFRSALDRAPDFLEGRIQLAAVVQMQGRYEEANQAWHDVLALSPDHLEAHLRLAIGLYYLNDFATAWDHVHTVEGLGGEVPPQFRVLLAGPLPDLTPGSASANGPIIGPQVRIDVGGGTSAANETTVAVSGGSPSRIVAAWNDRRIGLLRMGVGLSFDGGETWRDFVLEAPKGHRSPVQGDPMTAFDKRTGTLWVGALSSSNDIGGLFVARLDPGETEFNPPVMALDDGHADKCWMAAGPLPWNEDATRLYVAFLNFYGGIVHSDDMGETWSDQVNLGGGLGHLPRVGPKGEVYVTFFEWFSELTLQRSLDGGETFTTHPIATRMDPWQTHDGTRFPGTFGVAPFVTFDVDPNDGTLYAVYADTTEIVDDNYNVDLYFCKSTDLGSTWTTPAIINDDADPPGDQFFPWLEVDDQGRIHIVFLDSRHTVQDDSNTNPDGFLDAYYTYSADGGETWTEFRLTPESWNSACSHGGWWIGDYLGLGVAGNRVYPVYLDTTGGDANIYTNVIVFSPPGDLNGDGTVGVVDLLILLANWGPCADCDDCPADLDDNCTVGVSDLLILLANWG